MLMVIKIMVAQHDKQINFEENVHNKGGEKSKLKEIARKYY